MTVARREAVVDLPPDAAFELWTDLDRWPAFVDGFAHAEHVDAGWPGEGAELVWRSIPTGRGVVTERVLASVPGERLVTHVVEDALSGTQTVRFEPEEDGAGSLVALELDYRVAGGGPLRGLTDLLFIRRAQNDALGRTLRRFATEAAEEASL